MENNFKTYLLEMQLWREAIKLEYTGSKPHEFVKESWVP